MCRTNSLADEDQTFLQRSAKTWKTLYVWCLCHRCAVQRPNKIASRLSQLYVTWSCTNFKQFIARSISTEGSTYIWHIYTWMWSPDSVHAIHVTYNFDRTWSCGYQCTKYARHIWLTTRIGDLLGLQSTLGMWTGFTVITISRDCHRYRWKKRKLQQEMNSVWSSSKNN